MGPVPAMRSGKQIWEEGVRNGLRAPFSFPPQSKFVVAKVNKVCYYGFARYIKAVDTGDNSGVWCFVIICNSQEYNNAIKHNCQVKNDNKNNFVFVPKIMEGFLCFMIIMFAYVILLTNLLLL